MLWLWVLSLIVSSLLYLVMKTMKGEHTVDLESQNDGTKTGEEVEEESGASSGDTH
jgi:hypothetical protein